METQRFLPVLLEYNVHWIHHDIVNTAPMSWVGPKATQPTQHPTVSPDKNTNDTPVKRAKSSRQHTKKAVSITESLARDMAQIADDVIRRTAGTCRHTV